MSTNAATQHKAVSKDEWLKASADFLVKEKEFTRERDRLSQLRRELPWTPVEKSYVFDTTEGKKTLSDLFGDKDQLMVYHFMFGPGWEEGCSGCSFVSDHFDAVVPHLANKDIAFVAVSRAPLAEFLPYKKAMGWEFPWVSSNGTDFNYDFGASFHAEDLKAGPVLYNFKMQKLNTEEQPGLTVFYKDEDGKIYRTYSTYERGLDMLVGVYNFIDLTPIGRNEEGPMDWIDFQGRRSEAHSEEQT